MVRTGAAIALACWLAGCGGGGGGGGVANPGIDASPDSPPPPPWWQPRGNGEAKNWDIQLSPAAGAVDVSVQRVMYDLDLWALVPAATVLDYGDGDPVTVPKGALPDTIARLHATTPPTIVICHVETGALELNRPDARKFPGYINPPSAIPDNPASPAAGSVIGWGLATPNERRLDVREASRARWISIMFKRFDLAKQIGCDGVEPERNQVPLTDNTTGFPALTAAESYSWYAELAKQGHQRMLSTGMKNGLAAGQPDYEAPMFDWLMVERCAEGQECDQTRPFVNMDKPVFEIEYSDTYATAAAQTAACTVLQTAQIVEGLIKDFPPTKNVRVPCSP